jgi:hypothetical protein
VIVTAAVFLIWASVSFGQQLDFDKEKFLKEHNALQKSLDRRGKLIRKHEYCVRCSNGTRLNCSFPIGGEVGRAHCGAYGLAACGGGQVDYNHC